MKEENKLIEKLDLSDWIEITSERDLEYPLLKEIFNKNAVAFSNKINEIIDKLNEIEK